MTDLEAPEAPEAPETPGQPETAGRTYSKLRAVFAGVLGALAIIGLFASTVAIWSSSVLFDSDAVAVAVDEALVQPEVNTALANYLTDQVFTVVAVDSLIGNVLPPALQRLQPAIAGGAHSFVESRLESVLARDDVRAAISRLVRIAHASLVKLLEGQSLVKGIATNDGEVSINLLPLVGRGLGAAQGLGLFDDVTIPVLTPDGDPVQQTSELEAAFGRELPEGFGQLVVFRSEKLAKAQQSVSNAQHVVVVVKRAIWVVLGLTVVLMAASLLVAQRRLRALLILALGAVAVMLVSRTVVQHVIDQLPALVVSPAARAALGASSRSLANGLLRGITAVLLVGLLTAVIAFFMGSSGVAVSVRSRLGSTGGSLRSTLAEHRDGVAFALFGTAVLVIALFGIGTLSLVIALLFALGGAAMMWGVGQPIVTE